MIVIRGTTPSITFTITQVRIADIAVAYMTMKQSGQLLLEKDLSEATTGDKMLTWDLSQSETLGIDPQATVSVQLRYRTNAGKAYASKIYNVPGYQILKDGEI